MKKALVVGKFDNNNPNNNNDFRQLKRSFNVSVSVCIAVLSWVMAVLSCCHTEHDCIKLAVHWCSE